MVATFPTPLSATVRYFPVSVRRYYYVPTIASPAAPTRAELTAGTDLTGDVVDGGVSGFTLDGALVDIPDMGSKFTSSIPGRQTAGTSSIKLYADQTSSDARTLFVATPTGSPTTGYIVILPEGEWVTAESKTMDVWPITVTSNATDQATAAAGQMTVTFGITSAPHTYVAIPSNT